MVVLMPVGVLLIARVPAENTLLGLADWAVKLAPEPTTTLMATKTPARVAKTWNRRFPIRILIRLIVAPSRSAQSVPLSIAALISVELAWFFSPMSRLPRQ